MYISMRDANQMKIQRKLCQAGNVRCTQKNVVDVSVDENK